MTQPLSAFVTRMQALLAQIQQAPDQQACMPSMRIKEGLPCDVLPAMLCAINRASRQEGTSASSMEGRLSSQSRRLRENVCA